MTYMQVNKLIQALEKSCAGEKGPFAKGYRRALAELREAVRAEAQKPA